MNFKKTKKPRRPKDKLTSYASWGKIRRDRDLKKDFLDEVKADRDRHLDKARELSKDLNQYVEFNESSGLYWYVDARGEVVTIDADGVTTEFFCRGS